MRNDLKPIRCEKAYEAALKEAERLWGAARGTPEGDHLDTLATQIDAYEAEHYPMDRPSPGAARKFRTEQRRRA